MQLGGLVQRITAFEDSVVSIAGGSVGFGFQAKDSKINFAGGTVGNVELLSGCELRMSGGEIFGSAFSHGVLAQLGSKVTVSGGKIGNRFILQGTMTEPATGTISDGELTGTIHVSSGSELRLVGSEFLLNGEQVDGLVLGDSFTTADREMTLPMRLRDGSLLEIDLGTTIVFGQDFVSPEATLIVTRHIPGDFSLDGEVNLEDFSVIKSNFGLPADSFTQGDGNFDGVVNLADFIILKANYGTSGAAQVPEPSSRALILLALAAYILPRVCRLPRPSSQGVE